MTRILTMGLISGLVMGQGGCVFRFCPLACVLSDDWGSGAGERMVQFFRRFSREC